jgi:hypothetical protein
MANKPTATRRSPSGASSTATARTGAKAPAKPVAVPGGSSSSDDARFDRLVYERVRLGIMSALAVNDRLTFNERAAKRSIATSNTSRQ